MTTPTYAAIIQISLPELPQTITANVKLTAGDDVPVNGRFKPLADCTLADLQNFADELEAEVWETVQQIRLIDLANDADAEVSLTILDEHGARVSPDRAWFQQAVLLPPENEAVNAAPAEEEAPFVPEEIESETESEAETEIEIEIETETEIEETAVDAQVEAAAESDPDEPVEPALAGAEVAAEEAAETAVVQVPASETTATDAVRPQKQAAHDIPDEVIESVAQRDPDEPQITVSEAEPVFDEPEVDESAAPARIEPSQARVRVAGRRLPNGHPTWAAVDILLDEPALRGAQAHALSSLDREVAGVLVGPRPEKQPDGRYVVHIIDTIEAKHTVMQGASVTYTPESWRYMNDELALRYPDETAVIVGWYHTHPGFGIFLSGMDQFIHQNFFTQIWHIAYVLDPRARTSGFFCWDRQKTRVSPVQFPWPAWAARSW